MSACYKHDSFALVLASCNFVGVPSLVNPRERGLLAGSLLHAALTRAAAAGKAEQPLLAGCYYPGGQQSCLGSSSAQLQC